MVRMNLSNDRGNARGGARPMFTRASRVKQKVFNVFQQSEMKATVSTMLQRGKKTIPNAYRSAKDMIQTASSKTTNAMFRNIRSGAALSKTPISVGKKIMSFGKGFAGAGLLVAGAAAMAGIAFMQGGMSQANDIMYERYMRDARYSTRLLNNTNVGAASGSGRSALSMGNHVGLALALNRRRHG